MGVRVRVAVGRAVGGGGGGGVKVGGGGGVGGTRVNVARAVGASVLVAVGFTRAIRLPVWQLRIARTPRQVSKTNLCRWAYCILRLPIVDCQLPIFDCRFKSQIENQKSFVICSFVIHQ